MLADRLASTFHYFGATEEDIRFEFSLGHEFDLADWIERDEEMEVFLTMFGGFSPEWQAQQDLTKLERYTKTVMKFVLLRSGAKNPLQGGPSVDGGGGGRAL